MEFVKENESEKFTVSQCTCLHCIQMQVAVQEWDTFIPKTALQKRMINVVKKIEDREKTKQ